MYSVSIIIPTLNEEEALPRLLDDIAVQTVLPYEVIVVDGDSEDRTRTYFAEWSKQHPQLKTLFFTSPRDVGTQRNLGADKASGEVFCFVDADTQLPKTFLEQCSESTQDLSADIWIPTFAPNHKRIHFQVFYYLFNLLFQLSHLTNRPAGAGMCMLVRKEVFSHHQFPENKHFEDLLFVSTASTDWNVKSIAATAVVSTRRFEHSGFWKTLGSYLRLSLRFIQGKPLESIDYDYSYRNDSKTG